MTVIVPYTRVRPATYTALAASGARVHYAPCPAADDYWRLLAASWRAGASFIVVEHDIVPSREALRDLWECPQPWCAQPYRHLTAQADGLLRDGLGCTKFASSAMRAAPDLFQRIAAMEFPNDPVRSCADWRGLDRFIIRILNAAGVLIHGHQIVVGHDSPALARPGV